MIQTIIAIELLVLGFLIGLVVERTWGMYKKLYREELKAHIASLKRASDSYGRIISSLEKGILIKSPIQINHENN